MYSSANGFHPTGLLVLAALCVKCADADAAVMCVGAGGADLLGGRVVGVGCFVMCFAGYVVD